MGKQYDNFISQKANECVIRKVKSCIAFDVNFNVFLFSELSSVKTQCSNT